MNIIIFKKIEGIFDLVCVVEVWMNLRFMQKNEGMINY
jgi:hypothetical protein